MISFIFSFALFLLFLIGVFIFVRFIWNDGVKYGYAQAIHFEYHRGEQTDTCPFCRKESIELKSGKR